MEKYSFSVDGIPVAVYPALALTEFADLTALKSFYDDGAILLLPEDKADYRIEFINGSNIGPREPHVYIAALSYLFSRVWGYPDMSLDILVQGNRYEIELDRNKRYSFTVNDGKCKILCAKTVEFFDGIAVNVNIVDSCGVYGTVICEDADLFDDERITLLFERLGECGAKAVLVISRSDTLKLKSFGSLPYYEAIRVALHALGGGGKALLYGRHTALVNGHIHDFTRDPGSLILHPEIKYIS